MELMIQALRVGDDRLNALATEVVARFWPGIVRCLVLAAANRKHGPGHRVRLLQAIQRVGVISDPANFFDVLSLTTDKRPEVRAAAAELIVGLRDRPDGGLCDA
jgi:hypothetical protein